MSLPEFNLAFLNFLSVPFHMHPVFVHFVVVLPLIILLLEVFNLFAKRRVVEIVSIALISLLVVALALVYVAGIGDGKEAFDSLDSVAQEALKSHKLLGTYLVVIGTSLIVALKLVSMFIQKTYYKLLYILVLLLFIGVILKQGKDGGELVDMYGVNVKKAKELDDKLFDTQMKYDDLNKSFMLLKTNFQKAIDSNRTKDFNKTLEVNKTISPTAVTQPPLLHGLNATKKL